ncbi:MAG: alpha-1,4-glucan--maltose-1-phosphate maltosyltransferase [Pseudohongiella sp.]|nr:alpha-1,4-glucan--maltose-1-phosphate maltosyltransferase [Pseudohongiella sp.]MDO9521181.1 alpha-1,4-glucan--maltose-1-phosphate maltosyltransferase [Pseudohongiella sp.]MDP2127363.1 alpha-1,4-glucan--maltose-1-phosphate maltosyltransferase [Pseudohongiella sp.]
MNKQTLPVQHQNTGGGQQTKSVAPALLPVEYYATRQLRIAIDSVSPAVLNGRFAAKAVVGKRVTVTAILLVDGHEKLSAQVLWRYIDESRWKKQELHHVGNDRWQADLTGDRVGRVEFLVEAWIDPYLNLCDELKKKYDAGQDISLELEEARYLLKTVADKTSADNMSAVVELGRRLDRTEFLADKVSLLLSQQSAEKLAFAQSKSHLLQSKIYLLDVDRRAAEFASWYELFPRSVTQDRGRPGTFRDVIERLPQISAMGFDVLYFPPIHPIGRTHRKGANNALTAGADDPGSPYAIGSEEGGHDAIHPELGTLDDFLFLVEAARKHQLEIALDFAVQCSPDHPWLKQRPDWFCWRPDGSVKYAENPPKKYEDIVNVDFYAKGAIPDLWLALRDIVTAWVSRGVKTFRVDNPHTKPLPFWEWLIAEVRTAHPEVIFLAEAFTRPAMMVRLGKLGFSQSYTYFTWRNTKQELAQYFTELNGYPWKDCYRPNFFVNTPDINPEFLHTSGRAGFLIRAALATMGSGLWGMYSGFEICESAPVPGKEEYLNSEKYEIRPRDYQQPGNIVAEITQLNNIRRRNPALQTHLGLAVYQVWNDNIILFGKRTKDMSNFILIAVSLDPFNAQEAEFELPLWEFNLPDDAVMVGEDLMNGHSWLWYGKRQRMRIEPWHMPFGIWRLRPAR